MTRPEQTPVGLGHLGGAPLILPHEDPGATPKPCGTTGLCSYAIQLPTRVTLAKALRRLLSQEYSLQGAVDHLVRQAVDLADSDGHGTENYRHRSREARPRENGELRTANDPLSLDTVRVVAGPDDGVWDGFPERTGIGQA